MTTTLTRPTKLQYGTRSYVGEVDAGAPADVPILAEDVDNDLDPLYAGFNALIAGGIQALVVIGPTAPPSPVVGQLWWRTTDGNLYVYYNDGTTAQFVPAMASVGKLIAGQYYLLAGASAGVPAASLSVGLYVAALAFSLPLNLSGSQGVAKIAATAQTDFPIQINGVPQGSIRWAAGATVATFVWPATLALAAGDRVEILAPAAPDATLANPAWTLRGVL